MEAEVVDFMAVEAEDSTGEADSAAGEVLVAGGRMAGALAAGGLMAVECIAAGMDRADMAGEPMAVEDRCRRVMAAGDSGIIVQAGQVDLADAA
jgi:short subunit dehydrogenase-like uncharacterized protein